MGEQDYREQAQRSDGIRVIYYPPSERGQRPVLQTLEFVHLGDFRVDPERWTDGGSVPGIARSVAAPLGYLFRAFLIHDTSLFDGYGWTESNKRLRRAMRLLNAPAWQRVAVMAAVRGNAILQRTKARLGLSGMYV